MEGERWGGGHPNDSFLHELPDSLTRVALTFADGAHLYFNDLRKLWLDEALSYTRGGAAALYAKSRPSRSIRIRRQRSLSRAFAGAMARPSRRPSSTKTTIAGVGNIYADESLWMTQLHPATRVRMVDDEQLAALFVHIRQVLQLSIDKGGSTDRNYVDAEGKKGELSGLCAGVSA